MPSRRSMRLGRWLLVLLVGCGGAQANVTSDITIPSRFPPKHAVEELARAQAKPLPRRAVATASQWRVDAAPERAPIEARFPGVTFTKELRCVAREYGKLQAEKGVGQPDERLDRFIIGACGLSSPKVTTVSWKTTVPESTSDDAVVASFGATTPFPAEMKGRPAGAWITRKNDQAILTLVSGTTVDAVTVTLADPAGRVIVQGRADGDIIAAKINRGHDGVARCELDPRAVRRAFRFTCTLAEGDPWAWIEVLTQHPSDYALVSSRALVLWPGAAQSTRDVQYALGGNGAGDLASRLPLLCAPS